MRGTIKGMGDRQTYWIDGREATRTEFRKAFPAQPLGSAECITAWKRPILSDALAVHPDQIPEVLERNRQHGIYIDYAPDGRPILTNRRDRAKLLKLEGCHDHSGGYGDG